jgi:hypothetical protein
MDSSCPSSDKVVDPGSSRQVNSPTFDTLRTLRKRHRQTRERWEMLLRIEKIRSPLSNPDALVHLFDWTLGQICVSLAGNENTETNDSPQETIGGSSSNCGCGRNPYIGYYKAAKQAMIEALVLEQAEAPNLDANDRDTALLHLTRALDRLGRKEVSSFCALCVHRHDSVE